MAKVIVRRDQQAEMRRLHPMPAYSRVVTIEHVDPAPGGQDFAVTPALADKLWLLSVDVWITGQGLPVATSWWFDLRRGLRKPATRLAVQQWEYLLPVLAMTGTWIFNGYGNPVHRHWDMNVWYESPAQRFAVIGHMVGPVLSRITASFRISEG